MSDQPMGRVFGPSTASDPHTSQAILTEIAGNQPELRAAVARNPSASPELLNWLAGLGDPEVNQALAQRGFDARANAPLVGAAVSGPGAGPASTPTVPPNTMPPPGPGMMPTGPGAPKVGAFGERPGIFSAQPQAMLGALLLFGGALVVGLLAVVVVWQNGDTTLSYGYRADSWAFWPYTAGWLMLAGMLVLAGAGVSELLGGDGHAMAPAIILSIPFAVAAGTAIVGVKYASDDAHFLIYFFSSQSTNATAYISWAGMVFLAIAILAITLALCAYFAWVGTHNVELAQILRWVVVALAVVVAVWLIWVKGALGSVPIVAGCVLALRLRPIAYGGAAVCLIPMVFFEHARTEWVSWATYFSHLAPGFTAASGTYYWLQRLVTSLLVAAIGIGFAFLFHWMAVGGSLSQLAPAAVAMRSAPGPMSAPAPMRAPAPAQAPSPMPASSPPQASDPNPGTGAPPAPAPGPGMVYPAMVQYVSDRTSGLAIVSLVTSLLGMSVIAVICGHLALSEIRRERCRGHGMAIAGLVIGYITLVLEIAFLIFIWVVAAKLNSDLNNSYYDY